MVVKFLHCRTAKMERGSKLFCQSRPKYRTRKISSYKSEYSVAIDVVHAEAQRAKIYQLVRKLLEKYAFLILLVTQVPSSRS